MIDSSSCTDKPGVLNMDNIKDLVIHIREDFTLEKSYLETEIIEIRSFLENRYFKMFTSHLKKTGLISDIASHEKACSSSNEIDILKNSSRSSSIGSTSVATTTSEDSSSCSERYMSSCRDRILRGRLPSSRVMDACIESSLIRSKTSHPQTTITSTNNKILNRILMAKDEIHFLDDFG
jgi:hypothetical protein